jgi:hypothetical protein
MSNATATASVPAVAAAPKISAGEAAITKAVSKAASHKELVKALWSIRGDLKVVAPGFDKPVAVVKAEIVRALQAAKDQNSAAPYYLEKGGKDEWILRAAAKK